MNTNLINSISTIEAENKFSGKVLCKKRSGSMERTRLWICNRTEQLINYGSTRYGIASGSKLFTSIAICQLVMDGKLSFDSKLTECFNISFPNLILTNYVFF